MSILLSSQTNAIETSVAGTFSVDLLKPIFDLLPEYIQGKFTELQTAQAALDNAMSLEKRNDFTEALVTADDKFDTQAKCVKAFVAANKLSSDPAIVAAATAAERVFELNDPMFYRLPYDYEVRQSQILIKDFASDKMKPHMDRLPRVVAELAILKQKEEVISDLLEQREKIEALQKAATPSYLQRKIVRDLLNDEIYPFISVMGKSNPTDFAEISKRLETRISNINDDVKLRMASSKNKSSEIETPEAQENDAVEE